MNRTNITKLGALTAILFASTSFENCANKQFTSIPVVDRSQKISSETVFPVDGVDGYIPGTGGDANGSIPILGSNGSSGNSSSGNIPSGSSGTGYIDPNSGGSGTIGGNGGTGGGSLFPSGSSSSSGTSTAGNTSSSSTGSTSGSLPGMPAETFIGSSDPGAVATTPGRGPASIPSTTGLVGGGVTTGTPIGNMPTPYQGKTMPIAFDCSDFRSDANGNLATAKSLVVDLTDNNGTPICSFTSATLRDTLLQTKTFDAGILDANCPGLKVGKYAVRLRDPLRSLPTGKLGNQPASNFLTDPRTTNLVYNSENKLGLVVEKKTDGSWARSDRYMTVLTDRNPYTNDGDKLANMTLLTSRAQCDAHQSPLVIHLNSDPATREHFNLTSQTFGIMFDILGQNSYPTAFTPKRISWHRSLTYLFLALPDANGNVTGIDQLFGNNTMGPDGRTALNGYEALAKYDGKSVDGKTAVGLADGYINRFDPIYSKLRVWRDENFDGIAQPNELYSLSNAGIQVIDLHYDPSFYERDKYGNETKYKSVVQTRDGKLHLMFDVWFAYLER